MLCVLSLEVKNVDKSHYQRDVLLSVGSILEHEGTKGAPNTPRNRWSWNLVYRFRHTISLLELEVDREPEGEEDNT